MLLHIVCRDWHYAVHVHNCLQSLFGSFLSDQPICDWEHILKLSYNKIILENGQIEQKELTQEGPFATAEPLHVITICI